MPFATGNWKSSPWPAVVLARSAAVENSAVGTPARVPMVAADSVSVTLCPSVRNASPDQLPSSPVVIDAPPACSSNTGCSVVRPVVWKLIGSVSPISYFDRLPGDSTWMDVADGLSCACAVSPS